MVLVGLFSAIALSVSTMLVQCSRPTTTTTSAPTVRQLFLGVDGVGWETFQYAQQHGLFKRFTHAGRMIAPYPAMSHGSWTDIMGARRVFGDRGRLPTVEAKWFDLEQMRVADDPRLVFARSASPYNYMRAFDTYFDPLLEPLLYFPGHRLFDRELDETERAILDGFTGDRYTVYISGTDAMAHTHLNELHAYLVQLDAMIEHVVTALESRSGPVDVWLVSDHGNAGAFREGDPESYLGIVNIDRAIARAGLVRQDTGTVTDSSHVAVVTLALASMIDLYFPDLSKRRRLVDEVLHEGGVSLATWLEVTDSARAIIVRSATNGEAKVLWRDAPGGASRDASFEYAYVATSGNPFMLPESLISSPTAMRWIADSTMRNATIDGPFPDALHKLVASAAKSVENAPDLIINLDDAYAHEGELSRIVRMVRTHGSLSSRSSLGVIASTRSIVPHDVRAEEVADVMHVAPRALFKNAEWLHPRDVRAAAESLARASPLSTCAHRPSHRARRSQACPWAPACLP